MTVNKTLPVAAAPNHDSLTWVNSSASLADLLAAARSAPEATAKGTHGCLFPGVLKTSPGERRTPNIAQRTVLLLDFDDAQDWTPEGFPWCSVAYETLSSKPGCRKYRVPTALDRPVLPHEWRQVAAAVADYLALLGVPAPDPSCLNWNQYMFMPERRPGVALAAWDHSTRPVLVVDDLIRDGAELVEVHTDHSGGALRDPFDLPGAVGAFNRAYESLDDLIAAFDLPYVVDGSRWQLVGSLNGAGVNEVAPGWWYSHHATDPAGGHVHSAFDLVRIHRFGKLDGDSPAPDWEPGQSHDEMTSLAMGDARVLAELGVADDFAEPGSAERPRVLIQSAAHGAEWGRTSTGIGRLSDVMRRGNALVSVVCEGEDGYIYPADEDDTNGHSQIVGLTPDGLHARMVYRHRFFTPNRNGVSPYALQKQVATFAVSAATELPNVRELIGVTDFPLVRRDGTLLETPGYDATSRLYYAPRGDAPTIPAKPSREDVEAALARLEYVFCDFPFRSDDDRANWLGVVLTPALRLLVPGPYKGVLIDAPDSGTGKTLLSNTLAELYGAAKRSSWPTDEAEVGKEIGTIFDTTEAPVVIFDNVSGTLKSRKVEALLTSAEFAERRLGSSTAIGGRNDRVWCWTANNLSVGGDLARRLLVVSIDAGGPRPDLREGFHEADLLRYVREHRSELLGSVLTLVRAWVQAGAKPAKVAGSDGFSAWRGTVTGILQFADIAGQFDSESSRVEAESSDDNEWAAFLAAIHAAFGTRRWQAKDLVYNSKIPEEAWPEELLGVRADPRRSLAKSLGRWLKHRERRWAGGMCVRRYDQNNRDGAIWWIDRQEPKS